MISDYAQVFLSILFEAIPFVLLGAIISGVVEVTVSREAIQRFLPRNRILATALGALLGLVMPMCECGIVPVVRRLLKKGVPLSCAIAYMLAAPVVNPIVLASTLAAFRGQSAIQVASLRGGLAFCVALIAGLIVPIIARTPESDAIHLPSALEREHPAEAPQSGSGKVRAVLQHTAEDFLEIGFFLILGSAVAAFLNVGVNREVMQRWGGNPVLSVGSLMVLAFLLSLCSEADAFIAATFTAFVLPGKLAFLVFGPMMDVKLLLMYTRLWSPRHIVAIVGSVTLLVFGACVALSFSALR